MRMRMIVGIVACGVWLLALASTFVGCSLAHNARLAPFRDHISEYLAPDQGMFHQEDAGPPSYKPKLVLVDEKKKEIDGLQFELPEEIGARKHEEVGTVARLKWGQNVYPLKGGGTATQDFCMIDLMDLASKQSIVINKRITGPPPQVQGIAEDPDKRSMQTRMIDYFKSLRRR
jgi:hypothetical protein